MKVTVYEYEEEDVSVEVTYITEDEHRKLLRDSLFIVNKKFLKTIKETKEERWVCQTPNAVGRKLGVEFVIKGR